MTVKDAHNYLVQTVAPNASNDANDRYIADFFDSLVVENNVNTIRLLICLAIDIKSSVKKLGTSVMTSNSVLMATRQCILDTANYAPSLKSAPAGISGMHNLFKFSSAQRLISPQLFSPCVQCHSEHHYSRVSSFRSYMLYLVKINCDPDLNPEIVEDIDGNELDRYHQEFTNDKYRNIKVYNLGRKDSWVFIADKKELESIGYENTYDILNRLGFYTGAIQPGDHYVCVEYGDEFAEHTYQPNTLTGDWGSLNAKAEFNGNDFFLSYFVHDDWGRTHSVTGIKGQFKERVHKNFKHDNGKFFDTKTHELAQLMVNLVPSSEDEIIGEALDRFSKS